MTLSTRARLGFLSDALELGDARELLNCPIFVKPR